VGRESTEGERRSGDAHCPRGDEGPCGHFSHWTLGNSYPIDMKAACVIRAANRKSNRVGGQTVSQWDRRTLPDAEFPPDG
jgi:hypothetical protein